MIVHRNGPAARYAAEWARRSVAKGLLAPGCEVRKGYRQQRLYRVLRRPHLRILSLPPAKEPRQMGNSESWVPTAPAIDRSPSQVLPVAATARTGILRNL